MARIEMKGLDEYTAALSRLERSLKESVIRPAIYDGADISADAIRGELQALPTQGGMGPPVARVPLQGPNKAQKKALLESFGITKMREDDGSYDVRLGFDGYNKIKTKTWPKGQPNVVVARAVERGTSFMAANPFIKRAMGRARKPALGAMRKSVDKSLKNIMKT